MGKFSALTIFRYLRFFVQTILKQFVLCVTLDNQVCNVNHSNSFKNLVTLCAIILPICSSYRVCYELLDL